MVELDKSVEDVTEELVISEPEQEERRENLYTKDPLLEVRNLKTWFPIRSGFFARTHDYVRAVDDVSFDVYPGETLGLVGESGCGKTTLGRTILRLIEATDGSVKFEGQELIGLGGEEIRQLRKHIQIIFQDPYSSLNPRMTVGDAIMEPLTIHNMLPNRQSRRDRVMELLTHVSLMPQHYNRYPHEFSGGQRQRICIARALALNPKFIICDESVSALDVSVQAQVLNLLNQLKNEFNFTYIFISHDLSVVKFMSDRMIVMKEGKIEQIGYAEDIYANPETDYTKALVTSIPKGEVNDIKAHLAAKNQRMAN
tara:strand:- start:1927 stop:2862 length:936 start_codon:yes stop_codon:yes gene_type:complete